jgi:hypothetical protein
MYLSKCVVPLKGRTWLQPKYLISLKVTNALAYFMAMLIIVTKSFVLSTSEAMMVKAAVLYYES